MVVVYVEGEIVGNRSNPLLLGNLGEASIFEKIGTN